MLSALFQSTETRALSGSIWGDWPGDNVTSSARPVDQTSALQLLAVYGCVRLISDSISTLPVDVYRSTPTQIVEANKPMWLRRPTTDLDFEAWCGQVLSSLLLHGNAYIDVLRSDSAQIVELVPLDPMKVSVQRESGRKVFYVDGRRTTSEIIHIRGLMLAGSDVGLSPIEYARRSIGLGLSSLDFGSSFFDQEGNMPGVIEMPGSAQPETMDNLAKQWRRKRQKSGKGLPGVLQGGATWKPTGVTNEQAQFLSTRSYTAAEIAGQMFLVDPSDLGIPVAGTSLTYSNLEQRNARRVQVTLLPWIVRIEKALSTLLAQPRYVKFNVEGLLRGDQKTRFESYEIGIRSQFMLPNEARDLEDWAPLVTSPPSPMVEPTEGESP